MDLCLRLTPFFAILYLHQYALWEHLFDTKHVSESSSTTSSSLPNNTSSNSLSASNHGKQSLSSLPQGFNSSFHSFQQDLINKEIKPLHMIGKSTQIHTVSTQHDNINASSSISMVQQNMREKASLILSALMSYDHNIKSYAN